jgi:hypothetical protein
MICKFPLKTNQRYYEVHYKYVLNVLTKGFDVKFEKGLDIDDLRFKCIIDEKEVVFDFADSSSDIRLDLAEKSKAYFKFHLKKEDYKNNVYPFPSVSFYDWVEFQRLSGSINYTCNSEVVLNNQRAWGGATLRRTMVKNILSPLKADFSMTDQKTFWNKFNNCLTYVHVPGQNNNMCDRATLQAFGLGAAIITTEFNECLPFGLEFIPNIDYVCVKNDWSDLIQKIDWVKGNKDKAIQMGLNAKNKFMQSCIPEKINEWVRLKL